MKIYTNNIADNANETKDTAANAVAGISLKTLTEQHSVTVSNNLNDTTEQPALSLQLTAQTTALDYLVLKEISDDLAKRGAVWEDGAFKSSNEGRNTLLGDCLALKLHFNLFSAARTKFHAIYDEKGLPSTKSTSLMTKIVRYVFGTKAEKRVFDYARVLTIAEEEDVAPEEFAAFVAKHGGLEEIRRNGSDAAAKKEQRKDDIQKASNNLESMSDVIVAKVPLPKNIKLEGKTNFVAAIARLESDGTLSFLHVTANQALVESLITDAGKHFAKTTSHPTSTYVNGRITGTQQ